MDEMFRLFGDMPLVGLKSKFEVSVKSSKKLMLAEPNGQIECKSIVKTLVYIITGGNQIVVTVARHLLAVCCLAFSGNKTKQRKSKGGGARKAAERGGQ